MYIKDDFHFKDLKERCWSGAIYTLEKIEENDKEDEFMSFLEECFCGEIPDLVNVNDFLWFEDSYIFEMLDIKEE